MLCQNICRVGEELTGAVTVNGLHVSYYGREVLDNISFSFDSGKLIGIIGPNGAGKSTLMKAILGLIPRDSGNVTFDNKPLQKVRKKIAYVPQRSLIDWDFPITVLDTVVLGTFPKLGLFHRPKKEHKRFAYDCLEKVGMQSFSDRHISELSGGQQQRVFLARALAQNANYLFLDEPFVGIDVTSEKMIIKILKQLRDEGQSVFVVHHDLSKVNEYFNELILINKSLIKCGAVKDVINPEIISKAYYNDLPLFDTIGVTM